MKNLKYHLKGLTVREMSVFILRRDAGWTFNRIGRLYGYSKTTARNIMAEALIKLRT